MPTRRSWPQSWPFAGRGGGPRPRGHHSRAGGGRGHHGGCAHGGRDGGADGGADHDDHHDDDEHDHGAWGAGVLGTAAR